jgi:hypothetical protein
VNAAATPRYGDKSRSIGLTQVTEGDEHMDYHFVFVRPGFGAALIPFGGSEEAVPDYEVLMEAGIWVAGSAGQIPDGAVVCGREANGDPLFVARANLNGGPNGARKLV